MKVSFLVYAFTFPLVFRNKLFKTFSSVKQNNFCQNDKDCKDTLSCCDMKIFKVCCKSKHKFYPHPFHYRPIKVPSS